MIRLLRHGGRPVVVDETTRTCYTRSSLGSLLAVPSGRPGAYRLADPHDPITVIAEAMLLVASEVTA